MAKNKKSATQKERDAKAKAARRHPKNETDSVIAIAPDQESKDLLNASKNPADALSEENPAGTGATSDQAAADPTINTQSASDDPPPIVSYMDGTDVDDIIDTADDPPPSKRYPTGDLDYHSDYDGQSVVPPGMKQAAKSNEEMALEMAAQAAVTETSEPFWVGMANVDLKGSFTAAWTKLSNALKPAHDAIVNGWIAFGAKCENGVDNLYTWAHKQNQELAVRWAKWFLKPDLVTKEYLVDTIKEAFVEVADVISESYNELNATNIRLASRIATLEKAVLGDAPRTVSADKLDDFIEAFSKGQKTKAATMYMALTGSTLAVAKAAVSNELTH